MPALSATENPREIRRWLKKKSCRPTLLPLYIHMATTRDRPRRRSRSLFDNSPTPPKAAPISFVLRHLCGFLFPLRSHQVERVALSNARATTCSHARYLFSDKGGAKKWKQLHIAKCRAPPICPPRAAIHPTNKQPQHGNWKFEAHDDQPQNPAFSPRSSPPSSWSSCPSWKPPRLPTPPS